LASRAGIRLVVSIAALQMAAGLLGWMAGDPETGLVPRWVMLFVPLVFGAAAILLLAGGRSDRRAVDLGVAFLLIAAAYRPRSLSDLATALPGASGALFLFLTGIETDTLIPLFLARFARSFPDRRLPPTTERLVNLAVRGVGLATGLLLGASLLPRAWRIPPFAWLDRLEAEGFHAILCPAALVLALIGARRASGVERRRARVFLAALALGLGPIAVEIALEALLPAYKRFALSPEVHPIYALVLFSLLGSIPFTTAYAVLVGRVLDVRLIARRALQQRYPHQVWKRLKAA
jgi:hypothetical protein